jgi:hypothetical protein
MSLARLTKKPENQQALAELHYDDDLFGEE